MMRDRGNRQVALSLRTTAWEGITLVLKSKFTERELPSVNMTSSSGVVDLFEIYIFIWWWRSGLVVKSSSYT